VAEHDFATVLRRIARGVLRIERDMVCCGVTLQQFETMREIDRAGTLQHGEIAARLAIDLSTASRNLQVLVRDGYVRRVAIKGDGRAVGNRLTAKGKRCVESLGCDERTVFDGILSRLPAAKRRGVREALVLLAEALGPGAPSECCATAGAKGCRARRAPRAESAPYATS